MLVKQACLLEALLHARESAVKTTKMKYLLDLQVSTYRLLAALLDDGSGWHASVKAVNAQFTREQKMLFA